MQKTTTLFIMNHETPDKAIADLAEGAALEQTHLSCLLLAPAPALPAYAYGMSSYGAMNVPDDWGEKLEEARHANRDRVQQINEILAHSQVSGEVQSILCATTDVKHYVARRARVCDIALLASNMLDTPNIMREAAHGVLFKSPAGLMLNASPSLKAKRVFIAWNSSDAASAAVHVALPYLKTADEVIIACFDPVMTDEKEGADPGTEVAAWLSHHGCNVTVSQRPSGGREIGQCIQNHAAEVGADLVVLGAYGHARMIEAIFGGTTRSMMEQTELPVLLAH